MRPSQQILHLLETWGPAHGLASSRAAFPTALFPPDLEMGKITNKAKETHIKVLSKKKKRSARLSQVPVSFPLEGNSFLHLHDRYLQKPHQDVCSQTVALFVLMSVTGRSSGNFCEIQDVSQSWSESCPSLTVLVLSKTP